MDDFAAKYVGAIQLFNEQEFFDCHDELEEIWAESFGDDKRFLQGLIQASVALFHFGNENLGGARKLYLSARQKFEGFPESYLGIELAKFRLEFDECFRELLDAGDVYPSGITLRDERIPQIHFVGQD